MTDEQSMEELSFSYLNAVAAMANIAVDRSLHDQDGMDGSIKKDFLQKNGQPIKCKVEYQLKSTTVFSEDEDQIRYSLKVKNYNDLRNDAVFYSVLFLLVMPKEKEDWMNLSVESLILRKCMYWLNLTGSPETTNESTITIYIPKSNIVTPESLEQILLNATKEKGGTP